MEETLLNNFQKENKYRKFTDVDPRRDRGMTLRTPRRRISPRTKQRYRAIKNFLRRTLGSVSQPNINTNTSESVSVSALKQKINGIEQQLNTVSKHCRDLACFEYNINPSTVSSIATVIPNNEDTRKGFNKINLTEPETKVLYQSLQDNETHQNLSNTKLKSRSSKNHVTKINAESKMINPNYTCYIEKRRSKRNTLDPIKESEQSRNHRHYYHVDYPDPQHSCSMHGPTFINIHQDAECSEVSRRNRRKNKTHDFNYIPTERNSVNNGMEGKCGDDKNKNYHRNKYTRSELDQDFITDIIRRQYKPVKLFGRRESDLSQFSAPVCRDQEFPTRELVQEGSELCSCCHKDSQRHRDSKYMCTNDLSDMRSICDTRLYSSRKHKNHLSRRKRFEDYNDSTMYDIVPVKEKSSPKSRRKFMEDNLHMLSTYKHREVPPSPRTHRPRLNLQAQLNIEKDDDDDFLIDNQLKHRKQDPRNKVLVQTSDNRSNVSSEVFIHNRNHRGLQKSQTPNNPKLKLNGDVAGTVRSLQSPDITNEHTNNDTTLNTQSVDMTADKTDKTLSEIKDILQSFLLEMKKESSQSEKLNTSPPNDIQQHSNNRNVFRNGECNCYNNNNSFSQCMPPFVQSFTNPCCYPFLPVCPINCMQNGLVVPSPSYTCTACAKNSKERTCGTNDSKNKSDSTQVTSSETQKLLKEIHKLISENPNSLQKQRSNNNNPAESKKYNETKILTSRSVGGSSKASKHDAKVGTQMKCYSKSCEAIGSKMNTNMHHATNVSYSDTILEKESSEETTNAQSSESEYSSESAVVDKKKSKFSKILRSIGLFKKDKNDVIEELSESESSTEVDKTETRPPFQQHIMNYNMYEQEYFHPPHAAYPPYSAHQHQCKQPQFNHPPYCSPRTCSPACGSPKMKDSHRRYSNEQDRTSHCVSPQHIPMQPYPNYYDPHYGNISPQVPLCLKEIEVKSIGTQSVKKMSFLQKFSNKMQVPVQKMKEPSQTQSSTQTTKDKGKSLFDWKKIQAKAMQDKTDPLKFSYKTSKKLAQGDMKMRNAMLKKLFYKRNPFSPRNLLVRTILGKDPSSFGEPPKMYKPSMFL